MPDSDKIVETINVSFDEKSSYKQNIDGAVLGTIPEEFQWVSATRGVFEEEDVVEEVRLTSDSSNDSLESPAGAERDSLDASSEDGSSIGSQPTLRETSWMRSVVPRKTGSRNDIYFFDEINNSQRLRSPREVMEYCRDNNVIFNPDLFDFKGSNTYQGIVPEPNSDVPSVDICQSQS